MTREDIVDAAGVTAGCRGRQTLSARLSALGLALLFCLFGAGAARAQMLTEFGTGLTFGAHFFSIAAGPDGNLWFTEGGDNSAIGRITPAGVITEFTAGIPALANVLGIAAGPDGNLWFTQYGRRFIGRITPDGVVTNFVNFPPGNDAPYLITAGPDGNLWFTADGTGRIGRITTDGVVTMFGTGITPGSRPFDITTGPDGNLWFTEANASKIGRITPSGVVTEFSVGITPGSLPYRITTGPDGNLWFTEAGNAKIGRITLAGVVTEFTAGPAFTSPFGISRGPGGTLWYSDTSFHKLGCMSMTGEHTLFDIGWAQGQTPTDMVIGPDGNLWAAGNTPDFPKIGRIVTPVHTLQGIALRRQHGAAGQFDLPLSLSPATPTIEPRIGPAHELVFTFDTLVNGANSAMTEGAATPTTLLQGNDVVVQLDNVTNGQYATVALTSIANSVNDCGSVAVRIGFLAGDVNQSGVVTLADLATVNAQLAQPVNSTNYLKDINASGTLSLADKGIANAFLTWSLPPP